ncbi:hypothetical protein PMIN04_003581 [Paraphaeosphaeria minitans]
MMTYPAPHYLQRRSLSTSSLSSSSSDASDHVQPRDSHTTVVLGHNQPAVMAGRAAFSQSPPNLGHQLDGAHSRAPQDVATMHPPRTQSHGAVASHFVGQPNAAYGGQTWVDFLRDSGADPSASVQQPRAPLQPNLHAPLPPLPVDSFPSRPSPHYSFTARPSAHTEGRPSRSSSERKRRLTTADSPFRRPSSMRMHSEDQPGSSRNPVVLGSSPAAAPAQRPSLQSHTSTGRRDSDFALPRWQPDSEVTHCFVCGSHFTFFYRKHHCRKCGSVVCSVCSPHRITIPRQYIVHPPHDNPNIIDQTSPDDDHPMSRFGPFGNPALGGGDEVRVCNPCVPDPNYSPPPQHGQTSPFPPFSPTAHSPHLTPSHALPRGPRSSHGSPQSVNDNARTASHGQAPRPRDLFTDRRTSYHGASRVADLWPPTPAPPHGYAQPPAHDHQTRPHSHSVLPANPQPTSSDFARQHSMPGSRRSFFAHGHPLPVPPPQPQPTPRRQIAEEDECPVCGNELPAKGPGGDEAERTQHVAECIALHSGSPPPAPTTPADLSSTSLPSQRPRGMSSVARNGEGSSNRMSMMARGMVPYVATEKDCVDEEGNEAECVICFEEFEAGDKMARLVCWCKFHESCIKEWWDKKGRGACPTHQLQC